MKIKELIKAFELAIPIYQKAVDENWDYSTLRHNNVNWGLCHFCGTRLGISLAKIFNSYYSRYLAHHGYLFEDPQPHYSISKNIDSCIKPRLNFMKSEVKDLKKLLKQGYTDV